MICLVAGAIELVNWPTKTRKDFTLVLSGSFVLGFDPQGAGIFGFSKKIERKSLWRW